MDTIQKNPSVAVGAAVVIGFILGLLYGWLINPVQWVVDDTSDLAVAACDAFRETQNIEFEDVARAVSGQGCDQFPSPDDGSTNFGVVLILVLAILVMATLIVLRRRNAAISSTATPSTEQPVFEDVPQAGPVGVDMQEETIPIARFRTTYSYGNDNYDDSFSIENSTGDFLGECGVSIGESIGTDVPKNVTAFEVWLFDKNDIRTLTKVIMSEHAFFDDAIKAKLAPKGEPVLASEAETVVLETASLIINAKITEMSYGTGVLPPQSFFERFTIELSAWAKEGDFEPPDLQNKVDEMLSF